MQKLITKQYMLNIFLKNVRNNADAVDGMLLLANCEVSFTLPEDSTEKEINDELEKTKKNFFWEALEMTVTPMND